MKRFPKTGTCACGRVHTAPVEQIVTGPGAISRLPELILRLGAEKPFLLSDINTEAAAGAAVKRILDDAGIAYGSYCFPDAHVEPDETAVGSAVMHFNASCDLIVGIGSGVINDISKILSHVSGRKFIIVGTAPSMDGYASATSSMSRDGLKVSLPTRMADIIVGDTDILAAAPLKMLRSGIGDMIAKYVSIAEWRIAHIITGEYYCEEIAQMIRDAVRNCTQNAQGLMQRENKAVAAVFDGLVTGGIAMAYAGVSRPASGVEHYFSHVWDMRALQFGTPCDLHGIQCAMATLQAVRLYEKVKKITPDREKALASVRAFDLEAWHKQLHSFLGESALTMIELEKKEGKYDPAKHAARLDVICENWDRILSILDEELPSASELEDLLDVLGIPKDLNAIGVDRECAQQTFRATKDIRDKYVLSRLAWDLGILDELCDTL